MRSLAKVEWIFRQRDHCERLAPLAEDRLQRRSAGIRHPVRDFLFEYYSYRPAQLLRWSPGVNVFLEGASPADLDWGSQFDERDGGLILTAESFPQHRIKFLQWTIGYLEGIRDRSPSFHCFGLHEWAMVYCAPTIRHSTPLRLATEAIAEVVEAAGVNCTHYDAFRFFTPEAVPLNRLQLTRTHTDLYDQKGCIHVTMDLYRYAFKLSPWSSGELIADAFLLAWEARQIDMRASPYDLRAFNLAPIPIETREGREEYVECQRELVRKAEPVRERLIEEYRRLLFCRGSAKMESIFL